MMARLIVALVAGFLFGAGLALSGMVNPAKVIGFLDVTGAWDPSLAGVMMGAIPVAALFFALARRREGPLVPTTVPPMRIDARLVIGALIFGIGWGLGGLCPGPAIAIVGSTGRVLPFLGAMIVGMALYRLIFQRDDSPKA